MNAIATLPTWDITAFRAALSDLRTEDVTAFSSASEWTGVHARDIEPWLRMRQTMVTASEVGAIMGEDSYKTAMAVYVDKRVDSVPERLPPWDPRRVGTILEQPLLADVALYRGWQYRPGGYLLRSKRYPFIGATLDAEIDRGDGVWLPLEGKTTELIGDWDEETGKVPDRVLLQVQTQLLVTGASYAIIFALLRQYKPFQVTVYPSTELHAVIVEHAEWFLDLVRRQTAPPVDGTERTRWALEKLYPKGNGLCVDLPADSVEWVREIQGLNEWARAIDQRKRYLQNTLRAHLGPATYGILPETVGGKSCVRWHGDEGKTRRLITLKLKPGGMRRIESPKVPTLADDLEASIASRAARTEKVTPLRRKRRKAR